jgi:hypothetical protein
MTASALIDMRQFAAEIIDRRNKAALLLTPDVREQRAYAAQLATALDGFHLDVLDQFQADEALTAQLVTFTIADLFSLIAEQKSHKLVIVSGIEFLLGAWLSQGDANQVKRSLCQQIEVWERHPAFILVTQDDATIAAYQPERHRGSRVVLNISNTLALE